MITEILYCNLDPKYIMSTTDLSLDELEAIVGRFKASHYARPGQLKGKLVKYIDGSIELRHHFTNKLLWTGDIVNTF